MRAAAGEFAYWDERMNALANIYDAIERLNYYTVRVQTEDRVDKPTPYPRPEKPMTAAEVDAAVRDGMQSLITQLEGLNR